MLTKILNDTEQAREEALQMLAEARDKKIPIFISLGLVLNMLATRGIEAPSDVLAWVSGGACRTSDITNWHSPVGA
jgi:hypothetical protein